MEVATSAPTIRLPTPEYSTRTRSRPNPPTRSEYPRGSHGVAASAEASAERVARRPGPLDYALDLVVARVAAAFDRPAAWADGNDFQLSRRAVKALKVYRGVELPTERWQKMLNEAYNKKPDAE